jgi:hypothetical protein
MGFKQSAEDALMHSRTVSALKVQVRKTKAQQCAHHGVGPFVPEEATLGVAPNLPSGRVSHLEDRHGHVTQITSRFFHRAYGSRHRASWLRLRSYVL